MNTSEKSTNSLSQTIKQMISSNKGCPSVEHLMFTIEHWEAHIQNLEQRLELIEQELANLTKK